MSKVSHIKSIILKSGDDFVSKVELERMDYIIDTMLSELASTTNLERSQVEEAITKFEVVKRSNGRSTSATFARRQPGYGHLPWPLNCHRTSKLCWPIPDEDGNIWCIEIEYPWPCPDVFR